MFDVNGGVGEGSLAEQSAQSAQYGTECDFAFPRWRVAPQHVHKVVAPGWPMPTGDEIDKGDATLPARQIAFVDAHATVVLGGDPASEVNARRQSRKLSANLRQSAASILRRHLRRVPMEKVINCPCGFVLRGQNDDEVVQKAQEHAKSVHGMDLSREQALEMARPA